LRHIGVAVRIGAHFAPANYRRRKRKTRRRKRTKTITCT